MQHGRSPLHTPSMMMLCLVLHIFWRGVSAALSLPVECSRIGDIRDGDACRHDLREGHTSPRASLRPGRPASRDCHSTYLGHPSLPLPASLIAAASPLVMLSHPWSSSRPPSSLFLLPRLPLIPFNTPHWAITVPPFVFTAPSRPPRYYPHSALPPSKTR